MNRRTRRAFLAVVAVGALAAGTPPAVANQLLLADIDITGVSFTPTGAVRVVGAYMCSSGHEAQSEFDRSGYLSQQLPDTYLESDSESFAVICDDAGHSFSLKFAGSREGETFRRHRPLMASVSLYATSVDGDSVSASHQLTTTGGTTQANIEVGSAAFTGDGAVRVTGSYICPIGSSAYSTTALVSQFAGRGHYKIRHFDRRLDCDGTWNELAVLFRLTRLGEPFQPNLVNSVQLAFTAVGADETLVQASDQDNLVIYP
jgi:hypothetical protein